MQVGQPNLDGWGTTMPDKPMIAGDHTFSADQSFDGMIGGDAVVATGVTLALSGMVGGNLIVENGAVVELSGMVGGAVVNRGGIVRSVS